MSELKALFGLSFLAAVLKDNRLSAELLFDESLSASRYRATMRNYKPSAYLCIDEQLVSFRRRCPFRIYMPIKLNKYGMKIVMLCDVASKYLLDIISRQCKTSMAAFTKNSTLISYRPKENKNVLLLSTMHTSNVLNPETSKPERKERWIHSIKCHRTCVVIEKLGAGLFAFPII
nr:unnamed protein product [Callosobruchus analis]